MKFEIRDEITDLLKIASVTNDSDSLANKIKQYRMHTLLSSTDKCSKRNMVVCMRTLMTNCKMGWQFGS